MLKRNLRQSNHKRRPSTCFTRESRLRRRKVRRSRLEPLEARRVLTGYIVDTVDDVVAADGFVSLREAIQAANSNSAVNEAAAGQVGATAGIDTISFSPSIGDATISLTDGELSLTDSVAIEPSFGQSIQIDAQGGSRLFSITDAGPVRLSGLTLTGGFAMSGGAIDVAGATSLELHDVDIVSNVATGDAANQGGGGINNVGANLVIIGGSISNNTASGASGSGGGILSTGGSVSIQSTTMSGNVANRAGGAIELGTGSLTLTDVMLGGFAVDDANVAGPGGSASPGNGGGIHVTGGASATSVAIFGGVIAGNFAASEGGGVWNQNGAVMSIAGNAEIVGNRAGGETNTEGGGGVFNNGGLLTITDARITDNATTGTAGGGGGIANDGGLVTVNRSIVSGNFAAGTGASGGGILNINAGKVSVIDSEITDNVASRAGGGIEDASDVLGVQGLSLQNVFLSDNNAGVIAADASAAAPGNGGGIHVTGAGDVLIADSFVSENIAAAEGGGLWNGSGTMTVINTTIERNSASGDAADDGGGGIFNNGGQVVIDGGVIESNMADGTSGSGGGILSLGGSLEISGAQIRNNSASRAGGGIEVTGDSDTVLSNVDLVENEAGPMGAAAPGNGGGLHVTGSGSVEIQGGTVMGNLADREGGGLWNGSGLMTLVDVDVMDNIARGDAADDGGGGIFNNTGQLIINGGNITGNVANGASGSGGGILNLDGILRVESTNLSENVANRAGGAVEATTDSESTLIDVTMESNTAGPVGSASPGNGGGLHVTGQGTVAVIGGTVRDNFAASEGGGLWNGTGVMAVSGTQIDGNVAAGNGVDQGGGGVFNAGGTIQIDSSTLTNNRATASTLVTLSGDAEVPSVATAATGTAAIQYDPNAGTFDLDVIVRGIELNDDTSLPELTGAHLHVAAAEANGPVIVNLGVENFVQDGNSIRLRLHDVELPESNFADFAAGGTYINLHSTTNPGGELRGQVVFPTTMGSGGGILNDGGTVEVSNTLIDGNIASRAGGGIEATPNSITTLSQVDLVSNIAGPSGFATPGNGGGLHITGDGDAVIENSRIESNHAGREGGGLWNGSGMMTVLSTDLMGNVASGDAADDGGGGIFNNGGSLTISGGTISENQADGTSGSGGGIMNLGGTLEISDATVGSNTSNRAGGGIEVTGGSESTIERVLLVGNVTGPDGMAMPGNGGGLHLGGDAIVDVINTTVSENQSGNEGGGLWNSSTGTLRVVSSTVALNASPRGGGIDTIDGGSTTIGSSIIAMNDADDGPNIHGAVTTDGFNVIGDTSGATFANTQPTDQLDVTNTGLQPLSDNGGPTMTHALSAGSPALASGDPDGVDVDQRGIARPQGDAPDSGAFESPLSAPVIAGVFQNPVMPTDVNGDSRTTALDALMVINFVARHGGDVDVEQLMTAEGESASVQTSADHPMVDVSGDGRITAIDALRVINTLARQTTQNDTTDQALVQVAADIQRSGLDDDEEWMDAIVDQVQ
ncbi:CHRD domain-containing protein [Crateriforma conspicua]|uniref:CHRD domain protein n=1 Tax=Crateriforma conspicua TaxID=2527996 RepID=A0A5C6FTJ3_9PLAN|nr:CHRD domain-containing protein [Crateriforma conspicua]TWU66199.1 CHRD domain protein [Crateriforma conspicua]